MNDKLNPLVLHAHSTGPNPYKVAIALEVLSIPYNVRLGELGDDPTKGVKGEAFRAINENSRLPALEDPNTCVTSWECGAVLNYILRVYDEDNHLGPRGLSEQDHVDYDKWILFLLTGLAPMTGQTNWYRHYNPTPNKDALQRYTAQVYRHYDVLESQLGKGGGHSIIPGGFCAADVHFYPWVDENHVAGISLDGHPKIKKWYHEIVVIKAVKDAYDKVPKGSIG